MVRSVRSGSLGAVDKETIGNNNLDFDYEDGEKEILDDLTDETGRQAAGGLPNLPSLLPAPNFPTIFDSIPTLPPLNVAALCANWYAVCFTILYGARKCCVGIVCPPIGIVCDPNERKSGKEDEEEEHTDDKKSFLKILSAYNKTRSNEIKRDSLFF